MNSQPRAFSASPLASFRTLVIALFISGMVLSAPLAAQTITIRLLNGKSGRPLTNKNVTLLWPPDFLPWEGTVVYIGKDGTGKVEIPAGAKYISVVGGAKIGKEPNRIPFLNCNAQDVQRLDIAQVLKNGYIPGNACSSKSAAPRPGEIVFWAMPTPWWMPDMQ
jgi:hypothetical protein